MLPNLLSCEVMCWICSADGVLVPLLYNSSRALSCSGVGFHLVLTATGSAAPFNCSLLFCSATKKHKPLVEKAEQLGKEKTIYKHVCACLD